MDDDIDVGVIIPIRLFRTKNLSLLHCVFFFISLL